jgi:hypothetical protein
MKRDACVTDSDIPSLSARRRRVASFTPLPLYRLGKNRQDPLGKGLHRARYRRERGVKRLDL